MVQASRPPDHGGRGHAGDLRRARDSRAAGTTCSANRRDCRSRSPVGQNTNAFIWDSVCKVVRVSAHRSTGPLNASRSCGAIRPITLYSRVIAAGGDGLSAAPSARSVTTTSRTQCATTTCSPILAAVPGLHCLCSQLPHGPGCPGAPLAYLSTPVQIIVGRDDPYGLATDGERCTSSCRTAGSMSSTVGITPGKKPPWLWRRRACQADCGFAARRSPRTASTRRSAHRQGCLRSEARPPKGEPLGADPAQGSSVWPRSQARKRHEQHSRRAVWSG